MTKTSMDENNNIVWSEGDQLVAFMGTTLKSKYQIKEGSVGSTSGSFTEVTEAEGSDLEEGQELDHNVVLYPYSSDVTCLKKDSRSYGLSVTLSGTQVYSKESFANGAFPMVAVSASNRVAFKNVCGGLKLQFKGVDAIKSIKLEGLSGERLAGPATVTAYADGADPEVNMSTDAASSILLDCGEGVQLDENVPTTFVIAVPPTTFASGMKITVTDTEGYSRVLANSSENTIIRSSLLTFPALTYTQVGVFELPEGVLESYEVLADGGSIEVSVRTNQDFNIVIPEEAKEWISVVESKAVREETVVFNVAENDGLDDRTAEILFIANDETVLQSINIFQEAVPMPVVDVEYIENGVNYGAGILIDDVIWAPVNVGAEIQSEYGDYYNWIEGHRICPEGWRVPSISEYSALEANSEWGELDGVEGRYFYGGKKYRTSIFLPAAGSDDERVQPGYAGYYLTSNNGSIPKYGYASTFTSTGVGGVPIDANSTQKYSVRCVAINEEEVTEKTINGLAWKTMNLGANKITGDGNCYNSELSALACPDGWRVPTMDEFNSLKQNYKFDNVDGVNGYWMSGTNIYPGQNTGIFVPCAKWYYNGRDGFEQRPEDDTDGFVYMTSSASTTLTGNQGFHFGLNNDFSITQMGQTTYYVPLRCVKGTLEEPYIKTSTISTLPYEGGELSIEITSNVEGFSLEISDDVASWITAEINGNTITVNVAENLAYYRNGKIRIIADSHSNTYKDIYIYQNGWVTDFNSSNYIVYKANATRVVTEGRYTNVYNYKSVIKSTGATGVKVEMKFQLTGSGTDYYLASSGNQWGDNYSSFEIPTTGFNLDGTLYTWSEMGVTNTSLITLVFDGSKGTITINNKKTLSTTLTSMSWTYLFSAYGRDSDEGVSYYDYGVPEGSKLYYVKMYDINGKETYVGHAAKAKNPATGKEEYCWYSNNNGVMECQFAYDSANKGGYTANF